MKVSLTLFLVLISTVSFSQVFKFGAKAGLNYNNYSPEIEGSESQIAYHFGGIVEYSFNERNDITCLKAELLLSSEGFKFADSYVDESINSYNLERDVKLTYLSLPILYKFRLVEKLYLESGPQVGYLISAKENNKYSFSDSSIGEASNDNGNIKEDYKPIKFQFVAGLGYLLTENISISARSVIGFTEIRKDTSLNTSTPETFTNSIVQFSVGYIF